MSLSFLIRDNLKSAIKARSALDVSVLRMLLSVLHNREIAEMHRLSKDEEVEVLSREVKLRREAIETYRAAGRPELAEKEEQEIRIIKDYLPEQLADNEVLELVQEAILEIGANAPQDIGRVMGVVMPKVKGRADGSEVRRLVEEMLQ